MLRAVRNGSSCGRQLHLARDATCHLRRNHFANFQLARSCKARRLRAKGDSGGRCSSILSRIPLRRRRTRASRFGRTSTMPARSARSQRPTSGSAIGAPADAVRHPRGGRALARRRVVADDLLRGLLPRRGRGGYREWNFAPSGNWAAYDFTGYREGMTRADVARRLTFAWRTISPGGRVGATIAVDAQTHWQLGLSAILEENGRHQILLGARASGWRQARFPCPRLLRRAPFLNSAP